MGLNEREIRQQETLSSVARRITLLHKIGDKQDIIPVVFHITDEPMSVINEGLVHRLRANNQSAQQLPLTLSELSHGKEGIQSVWAAINDLGESMGEGAIGVVQADISAMPQEEVIAFANAIVPNLAERPSLDKFIARHSSLAVTFSSDDYKLYEQLLREHSTGTRSLAQSGTLFTVMSLT